MRVFGKDDHRLMSKIMINITLPCTIIQAFDGFLSAMGGCSPSLGLAFFCAFLPDFHHVPDDWRRGNSCALTACSTSAGHNIGCFSRPQLVQAVFGNVGVFAACMFDTGNAVMMHRRCVCLMTSTLPRDRRRERESVGDILMKFIGSLPVWMRARR